MALVNVSMTFHVNNFVLTSSLSSINWSDRGFQMEFFQSSALNFHQLHAFCINAYNTVSNSKPHFITAVWTPTCMLENFQMLFTFGNDWKMYSIFSGNQACLGLPNNSRSVRVHNVLLDNTVITAVLKNFHFR